jgi:ribosomal protein S18 acetylase RimI-like enzyme
MQNYFFILFLWNKSFKLMINTMNQTVKLRVISVEDHEKLAKIHEAAFPDFFLTSLGIHFLKTYYFFSLKTEGSVSCCAVNENNDILGFAIGCLAAKGFHKKVFLKSPLAFINSLILSFLRNPKIIIRLWKNLEKKASKVDDKEYSELLSIAVGPENKGKGIGKILITGFENEIKKLKGKKIALTTDSSENESVISFYEKCGYVKTFEFVTYPNRLMFKMIKDL